MELMTLCLETVKTSKTCFKQSSDTFRFCLKRLLFDLGQDIFNGRRLEVKAFVNTDIIS